MIRLLQPTILKRLIFSLIIIVIPLYTINFILNNIGAHANQQELERSMAQSAKSFHRLIEAEWQQMANTMSESAMQIAMLQVENSSEELSKARKLLQIQSIAQHLQKSSRFVHSTTIYLPSYQTTVTNQGSSKVMDHEEYLQLSKMPPAKLVSWDEGVYMNFPYAVNQTDGLFLISIEINKTAMRFLLRDVIGFEQSGSLLIDDALNWDFSSESGSDAPRAILEEWYAVRDTHGEGTAASVEINNTSYFVSYDQSNQLGTTMLVYAPTEIIHKPLRMYWQAFQWMLITSLLIIILVSVWIYRTVHAPLKTLVKAFEEVEKGNLDFTVTPRNKDEFGYIYSRFNTTIQRLKDSVNRMIENESRRQRAELKRFQSQIDPHFLYNTFFVLSRLIRRENNQKASQFAHYLGQYFQFITYDNKDLIPLVSEIEHTKAYLEIQTVCFPQISVEFHELPEMLADDTVFVPRLIFQPLIENVYKHGFANTYSDGKIIIQFKVEKGYAVFIVKDNGIGMSETEINTFYQRLEMQDKEISGLVNVHNRVQLHFGGDSGLYLEQSTLGGLKIILKIRLSRGGNDV